MLSSILRRTVYFGVPALSAWYVFTVTRELAPARKAVIQTTLNPPRSLIDSYAVQKVVNPSAFSSKGDSRDTTISVPDGIPDEQLLSWFFNGFFGSRIFALEALILRAARIDESHFAELQNIPATEHIWYQQQMPKDALPGLHSALFGVFRIVDANLPSGTSRKSQQSEGESFVDVAFRSDVGGFAGCHRFSVARIKQSSGSSRVTPKLSCYVCNIEGGQKPFGGGIGGKIHLIYANLLFRAGIANVIRNLDGRSG